jgi:hypothetical protein
MSENPLVQALSQSVQSGSFSEAIKHLWSAQEILSSSDSSSYLCLKVTTLLNRLLSKYSSQIFLPLSRTYLMIIQASSNVQSPFLIKLANDVLLICEEIRGTETSESLENSMQALLSHLLSLPLESEQLEVIKSLKQEKNYSKHDQSFKSICEKLSQGQVSAAHDLFDILSSFERFSDQVSLFISKISLVSEALSKTTNIEVIKKSLTLLEHFIFKFNYTVQVSESSETYTVHLAQKLTRDLVPGVVSIINAILPYEAQINQHLLPILQRLWHLFPEDCQEYFDSTRLVLASIAGHGSADFKLRASGFLYDVVNSPSVPQHLKDFLESSEDLASLRSSEAFAPSSGILESETIIKLEELQPVVGMPMTAIIPAGSDFSYCVEVQEANSILSWGFATRDNDINFELKRIDLPTPQSLLKQDYIQCSELPFVQSRLINSPGLYKFTWCNKHSWFTEKIVRFRIVVLAPYHKTNSNEKDIHKVIEMVCNDEVSSTSKELLEVGIICKGKVVILSALGNTEEIPDLDVNAVRGFIQRVSNSSSFLGVKVGIVSKQPKRRNELKQLKAVFVSRDVDALALWNESEIHSDLLICVVVDEGIRSSVVHRGRILVDAEGRPIGDLARAGISDVEVGVAQLLSLFGPGTVVVSGSEAPSVASLIEYLKLQVPEAILKDSLVRGSVNGSEGMKIAACKLHHLYHKYQHPPR